MNYLATRILQTLKKVFTALLITAIVTAALPRLEISAER